MSIVSTLRERYTSALKRASVDALYYLYYLSVALSVEKNGGDESDIVKALQKELNDLYIEKIHLEDKIDIEVNQREINILTSLLPEQMNEYD